MNRISILIAEDHLTVYVAWKTFLEHDSRFVVIGHAMNGEEAISEALALKPDVILMDMKMPVMDGIDATRTICNLLPGSIIIGLSANTHPQQVRQFLEAGGSSYVTKYARATELKEAILSTLQGKRWICNHVKERFLTELAKTGESMENKLPLSIREQEVASFILQGHTSAGISLMLGISVRTVEVHRGKIFKKMGVKSRTQLANVLHQSGLAYSTGAYQKSSYNPEPSYAI